MGFMDMLGEMAGKTYSDLSQANTFKKEYKSLSDDKLMDILSKYSREKTRISSEGGQRYHAALSLLNERGYDKEILLKSY